MLHQNIYVCPVTGVELKLNIEVEQNGMIEKGFYSTSEGIKYAITDGIPDFTYPKKLSTKQMEHYQYYETHAEIYDDWQDLTFRIQNENESSVRKNMVNQLHLKPNSKVLELCCGTGIDSVHIISLLGKNAEFFVQDLSGAMLKQCKKKLAHSICPIHFSIGNATHLAFPNQYFDAVFCFGGLNVFDDIKRSLQEMVRVTKPNGRIVVGDESMPPWLYETEFAQILMQGNPLYKFQIPLESLPVEAREVKIEWIIGGVFYLISFTVGIGEPTGNFDLQIPGKRGGTLRTRYTGQLEGVTLETKKLVLEAAKKSNKSIHQWLDEVLNSCAKKSLNELVK